MNRELRNQRYLEEVDGAPRIHRPLIGVTMGREKSQRFFGLNLFIMNQTYVRILEALGALPVMIPLHMSEATLRGIFERLDGLFLPGGEDIDPANYGAERHEMLGATDKERDRTELLLTRTGEVRLAELEIRSDGQRTVVSGGLLEVELTLETREARRCIAYLGVGEGAAAPIFVLRRDLRVRSGRNRLRCVIQSLPLPRGRYSVWATLTDEHGRELAPWRVLGHLQVIGPDLPPLPRGFVRTSPILVPAEWSVSP